MKPLHLCVCVAVKHPRETNRSPWAGRNSTWIQKRYCVSCNSLQALGSLWKNDFRSWCEERSILSHESMSFFHHPSSIEMNSQPCFLLIPLQGIQFLLENDLLQHTPEDIAQFLYKGEGLNKTVIGDYLGERWDRASSRLQEKVLLTWDSWSCCD